MGKRHFILTTILFFILATAYSQDKSSERYKIIAAGSSNFTNGVCKIEIPENKASVADYYVVITPTTNFSELFVSVKAKEYFEVKSKNTQVGSFDYFVFEKRYKKTSIIVKQPNKK